MSQSKFRRVLSSARRRLRYAMPDKNPLHASSLWLRHPGPLAGRDVCLFVTYAPGSRVSEHALVYARAWAEAGFAVVLIIALDDLPGFDDGQDLEFCQGVLLRANVGYDFSAWAAAIRRLKGLRQAATVAIANDSVYGPLRGFDALIGKVRSSPADIVGLTESHERCRHLQSYTMFFKARAVRAPAFAKFWRGVRVGDRQYVIDHYELLLAQNMEAAGLTTTALFPADPSAPASNPTLLRWRELIEEGFPFVKAQVLREPAFQDSTAGWQELLASRGFDPAIAEHHLNSRRRDP